MRSDKAKNVIKVAKEYIKDPLANEREIAQRAGVDQSTVNRSKPHLHQIASKDPDIAEFLRQDFALMNKSVKEMYRRVDEEKEKISFGELNMAARESGKRYMLFAGDATDKKGGLKIETISCYQLNEDSA